MIRCDADKIQRVFDNLLKNAVIYSFEGTDIDIAVVGQGENVEITFTNHGDTIPEENWNGYLNSSTGWMLPEVRAAAGQGWVLP